MSFEAEGANVEVPEGAAPPEAAAAAAAAEPDVMGRLDQIQAQFQSQFAQMAERLPAPLAEEEEEPEVEPAPSVNDPEMVALLEGLPDEAFTAEGSLTAGGLQLLIDRQTDARIKRALETRDARETERQAHERRLAELETLEQRHPFMLDQAVADSVVNAAADRAQKLMRGTGQDYRLLLREPAFIEEQISLMYPDGAPAGSQPADVPLERPSAAGGAASAAGEMDEADRIVAAGARGRHSVGG